MPLKFVYVFCHETSHFFSCTNSALALHMSSRRRCGQWSFLVGYIANIYSLPIHLFTTLIPKINTATDLADIRPISCVNMMYKALTKILTTRMSKVVPELVSPHQTAFIEGRHISDNTILADEMVHGYGRIRTPNRCCLNIDLKKTFDTTSWKAILATLEAMGFSQLFCKIRGKFRRELLYENPIRKEGKS